MNKKVLSILITFLIILLFFLVYRYYFNLSLKDWPISCWVKKYLRLDCATCGVQRSMYYLFKGDLINAIKMNSLFILLLPLWIYVLYELVYGFINGSLEKFRLKYIVIFILLGFIFMIIRNLDVYKVLIN